MAYFQWEKKGYTESDYKNHYIHQPPIHPNRMIGEKLVENNQYIVINNKINIGIEALIYGFLRSDFLHVDCFDIKKEQMPV